MKPDSVCMACGGPVDEHGMYADGGEIGEADEHGRNDNDDDDADSPQMQESDDMEASARRSFVRAVRMKGGR